VGTVSRVLNAGTQVRDSTSRAVLEAIKGAPVPSQPRREPNVAELAACLAPRKIVLAASSTIRRSRSWVPAVMKSFRSACISARFSGRAGQTLSPRERKVLALVAIGEAGQTIAAELRISQGTVETYIRHCLTKLGAKNRPYAAVLALKRGDISLT
jgi:DNA-binding NarL/FixJ family response regulator